MSGYEVLFYPLFSVGTYSVSLVEFIGTLTGLFAVALAARPHILTWPIGIINVICFFILFYNSRLYADALLQIYYFIISINGWVHWNKTQEQKLISMLTIQQKVRMGILIIICSLVYGYIVSQLHNWLPDLFAHPADFPYLDGSLAIASVIATWLMAKGFLENWWLWITIDIGCSALYYYKDLKLLCLEYIIFTFLAIGGAYFWRRKYLKNKEINSI